MDLNQRRHQNQNQSTTFVQADPSNFRAIVQRLTGPERSISQTSGLPPQPRLHQRRQAMRNIDLVNGDHSCGHQQGPTLLLSPVSPLVMSMSTSASLGSPEYEERAAIAEKGFYLLDHPTRPDPTLLSLFPMRSPDDRS